MADNVLPAAARRALLEFDLVFVLSSFTFFMPTLDHLACMVSAAGLLEAFIFIYHAIVMPHSSQCTPFLSLLCSTLVLISSEYIVLSHFLIAPCPDP